MKRSRNADLAVELIREILLRLPVKTLLRCKCVCKEWRALIRSRSFIDGHFGQESNQDCLLFQLKRFPVDRSEFAMYPDDGRHYLSQMPTNIVSIMGPANGIFCAVSQFNRVALFNPATRKFKPVPPMPFYKPRGLIYGFGYDAFSGDYKVVAIHISGSPSFFYVYNLSSDSWRKIEGVDLLDTRIVMSATRVHNVAFNGVVHWINDKLDRGCKSILAFDLRSENFREILVPDAVRQADLHMAAYGDSIALMSKVDRCVYLWVMGRDGLWTKSFSINDTPPRYIWPLCVLNKNEVLLQRLERVTMDKRTSTLVKCDISTQKMRDFGLEFDDLIVSGVFSYKESLVSIEGELDGADCIRDFFV